MANFDKYYGKKVLVTGHTGFKGSWLTMWLKNLGANVVGVSLDPPSVPSNFCSSNVGLDIEDIRLDIRELSSLVDVVALHEPDFLFHLAAQPLVGVAYGNPIENWTTNLNGTLNVLESLRSLRKSCVAIFITSDKCYDNVEWVWGYRETDRLGGKDPYSASKAAAEIAISSYAQSFFPPSDIDLRIASVRAGNVIGGGDWAAHRIIPDAIRAWSENQALILRNPGSTRPWQHVLEPLSGYLWLALVLQEKESLNGHSFNFGPLEGQNHSVLDVVKEMTKHWAGAEYRVSSNQFDAAKESSLLKLNCDKALGYLGWHAALNFETTVEMTVSWYKDYYFGGGATEDLTLQQIHLFSKIAKEAGLEWAQ